MHRLTLYSRAGCHLCDQMKATIERVASRTPLALEEVDVSTDAALESRYGHEIPVLMLGEAEIARHRIDERRLWELLRNAGGN